MFENLRDALIAIVVLTAAFYLMRFSCRWLWRALSSKWKRGKKRIRPRVEFYRRLETLLGKHGICRTANQTPREFALAAGERLRGITADSAVAAIPLNVVDCFYRVRFGNDRLDTAEVQRLETWLGLLQQSLSVRKHT